MNAALCSELALAGEEGEQPPRYRIFPAEPHQDRPPSTNRRLAPRRSTASSAACLSSPMVSEIAWVAEPEIPPGSSADLRGRELDGGDHMGHVDRGPGRAW